MEQDGTLDAQDLLMWGTVDSARAGDEWERIDALCAWGQDFRIDVYVRYVQVFFVVTALTRMLRMEMGL